MMNTGQDPLSPHAAQWLKTVSSGVSERAFEWMSAAERAREVSSAEQANEWAVRANARMEERMTQYSTRRFPLIWNRCAEEANKRVVGRDAQY